MIQNEAAHMVSRTRKYDHISPVLRQLHWLPIKKCVVFKILLSTCRSLNGLAPGYIAHILELHSPARSLRSASEHLLSVPRTSLNNCGDRASSVAAPRLWKPPCQCTSKCQIPYQFSKESSKPIFLT